MNKKIFAIIVFLAILISLTPSSAQDAGFENPSAEDLAAMQEFLNALNTSTTTPANETDIMLNQTTEEFIKIFEELSNMLPSRPNENDTTPVERGKGNIFIKAFMILTLAFGVGISLLMLKKIDARERQFRSGRQSR